MVKNVWRLVPLLLCWLIIPNIATASSLLAILISTSDLKGSGATDISRGAEIGVTAMDRFLMDVAQQTDRAYLSQVIQRQNFSAVQINAAIHSLSPEPDDVVVFYYAGHGFHATQTSDKFPAMYVPSLQAGGFGGIQQTFVRSQLIAKRPRLVITIFDSCSVPLDGYPLNPLFMAPPRPPQTANAKASLRALFGVSGQITLAGSRVGEQSFVAIDRGGLFSLQLLNTLVASSRDGRMNWNDILSRATASIPINSRTTQQPVFELDVR